MKIFELHNRKPLKNPNFKQWFGESKAVDENGKPLVLFHGTAYDFDAFETDMIWASLEPRFASTYAELRAGWDDIKNEIGANVIPVYMKVEQPFNADFIGHTSKIDDFLLSLLEQAQNNGVNVDSLKQQTKETWTALTKGRYREESGPVYETHNFWYKPDWYFGKDAANMLRELFFSLNFDGIVYSEVSPSNNQDIMTWGTFYKQNVKSAIGNVGSYSLESSSIVEKSRHKNQKSSPF